MNDYEVIRLVTNWAALATFAISVAGMVVSALIFRVLRVCGSALAGLLRTDKHDRWDPLGTLHPIETKLIPPKR